MGSNKTKSVAKNLEQSERGQEKQMQDEDQNNQQTNEEEELEQQPSSEQEESTTEEQVEEQAPQEEEAQAEETAPEEETKEQEPQQPSRRESLRIQKLVSKLKEQSQTPQVPADKGVDFRNMIDADEEVYKQLDQSTQDYGKQVYNAGLEQAKSLQFHTRLEIDAPRVEAKYPQLDKSSDQFNPALADAVNQMYLSSAGYDPQTDTVRDSNTRYLDYVEAIFELGNEIAGAKTESTRKNIVKQAANTGLRPDGSSAKRLNLNQPVENMSAEELHAYGAKLGLAPTPPK